MEPVLQNDPLPFRSTAGAEEDPYAGALARVWERLKSKAEELPNLREAATQAVDALLSQEPPQRWLLVRNSDRYGTWLVADRLLRRCEATWPEAPEEALELAELCLQVAERVAAVESSNMASDLKARAMVNYGHGANVLGRRELAWDCLSVADRCRNLGTGDRLLAAEVASLEASLCHEIGDYDRALGLQDRALKLFLKAGSHHQAGKTLIHKGKTLIAVGRCREASWLLHQGLHWIDPQVEPRILLVVRHNLICCALLQGELRQAQALLEAANPLYEQYPSEVLEQRRKGLELLLRQLLTEDRRREGEASRLSPERRGRRLREAWAAHQDTA
jgi:tetratricopeptide (TPR) repeat protein